jgi:hypothetical protein
MLTPSATRSPGGGWGVAPDPIWKTKTKNENPAENFLSFSFSIDSSYELQCTNRFQKRANILDDIAQRGAGFKSLHDKGLRQPDWRVSELN